MSFIQLIKLFALGVLIKIAITAYIWIKKRHWIEKVFSLLIAAKNKIWNWCKKKKDNEKTG